MTVGRCAGLSGPHGHSVYTSLWQRQLPCRPVRRWTGATGKMSTCKSRNCVKMHAWSSSAYSASSNMATRAVTKMGVLSLGGLEAAANLSAIKISRAAYRGQTPQQWVEVLLSHRPSQRAVGVQMYEAR